MPELPEVEVICRGLRPHLIHRTVTKISYSEKPLRHPVKLKVMRQLLTGSHVTRIDRRAKYLLIRFNNSAVLIIHLGMTGNLGLFAIGSEKNFHDHLCWQLDNDRELRFNDTRRFGSVRIVHPKKSRLIEESYFNQTGVEPLEEQCDASYLLDKAKGKRRAVKTFLMDSKIIAGIGNIYANETLFSAKIDPNRPAGSLTSTEWQVIVKQLQTTLLHAISCGGATISDFVNADGTSGYFQMNFKVYGKTGTPCPVCGMLIEKIKLSGRATFFCPVCQSA